MSPDRFVIALDKTQFPEPHDPEHAIKLDKESNGYCPLCGYWSIVTDLVIDFKTGERGDKCQNCDTIFDASELVFIDSQVCKCGHPRIFHEKSYLNCEKGQELYNCQCKKYEPTQVTIVPLSQKEK
jgi:formate dehydrogenase maturation protein FdhE